MADGPPLCRAYAAPMVRPIVRTATLAMMLTIVFGALAACQATATPTPPPASDVTITIPVPVADKAVATAALDVLQARIRQLGYGTFSSSIGDVMTFTFPGDPSPDPEAIRAVLGAHGSFSILPLPGDAEVPPDGAPAPVGIEPLVDPGDVVTSASVVDDTGAPSLEIDLGPAATAAVAEYTDTHVGDYLVLVLDGKVLASPMVMASIDDGRVVISFPSDRSAADLERLAAVLASGPLPTEWP